MSKEPDKFLVRLKPGQRDALKERAAKEHRPMNDVIVTALDKHLEHGDAFDALLDVVKRALEPQTSTFVTIKREHLQRLCRTLMALDELGTTNGDPAVAAAFAILGGQHG